MKKTGALFFRDCLSRQSLDLKSRKFGQEGYVAYLASSEVSVA